MDDKPIDPKLISRLGERKAVPARDPHAAARGRSRFLTEASHLRETASRRMDQRHTGWNQVFRKEMSIMKTMITALSVLLLLFASATTVFAAQNDLPTDPLYGIKTLSENAGLFFTTDPAEKLERSMELAQVRVQEMNALAEGGETIPAEVTERLQLHIQTALRLAAGQSDEEMQVSLLRIQSQLQIQEHTMKQLQSHAPDEESQPALEQARIMTQEQLGLANEGLQDPQQFRNRFRHGNPATTATPIPTLTEVPTEQPTGAPYGNGMGGPTMQPTPGAGNGNENGNGPYPTPNGNGNDSGNGNGNGGGGGGGGSGGHP